MSTAITQRPVTTSSMIGGQILSQKQRRQVSRKQQQQQRKANDEEAINRIIKEIKIIGKSNSYPNIVNFYVVTSALSKCLLFLQNTDLGSIPLYLKNNFAERSIINEKIAGKITGFNKYVLRKDQINNNTNTTNFVTSRRRSRLLSEKPKNLHIKDKQLTTTESSPLSQKTKSEEQELEHPLVEAVSKIIIDALSETDNFGRIGAEVYKYLDKCDQELKINSRFGFGTARDQEKVFFLHHPLNNGYEDASKPLERLLAQQAACCVFL
ncbi:9798_t:CDS:2 [Ambispora gerdemannii]|uniref:9798_t:CDS:1 n=1 Tax=Ambispora gerdemannii TaxID=144530 RepID=A0A9N9C572_9GLOM|nr:9798_t:CDS:2 [Ambispora gerdemannii]